MQLCWYKANRNKDTDVLIYADNNGDIAYRFQKHTNLLKFIIEKDQSTNTKSLMLCKIILILKRIQQNI